MCGLNRPRRAIGALCRGVTASDSLLWPIAAHAFQRACRKFLALTARRAWWSTLPPPVRGDAMILSAIAEKLKRRSKDDFKGRHFGASLILQAVSWYLRYPLSYRDIEELFRERGLAGWTTPP